MFLEQTYNFWLFMLMLMHCEGDYVSNEKPLKNVQTPLEVETICSTDKLIVKGYNVNINLVLTAACLREVKFIEIFAVNNLTINADLNLTGQQVQLSLIAPVWEVIGNRKIILNGKHGDEHKLPYAPDGIGSFRHGLPGKPGVSGGKFLGIAHNVINGANLEIHMNGGTGGPGQHGGKGVNGVDGEDPPIPATSVDASPLWESLKFAHYIKDNFNSTPEGAGFTMNYITMRVFARNATRPGDGGHGGAGGIGGYRGTHFILVLEGERKMSILAKGGDNGVAGKGGLPGAPSKSGIIDVSFINEYSNSTDEVITYGNSSAELIDSSQSTGMNGTDGHNHEKIENPDATDLINPSHVINNYKRFVRSSIVIDGHKGDSEFVEGIEKHEHVQWLYKTSGYVDEMLGIETQYSELKKKTSLTPYYRSLLKRTEQFARNFTEPIENKGVLTWLYTAITTRMRAVRTAPIVDLPKYLNEIEASILRLRQNKIDADVEDRKNFWNIRIRSVATFINGQILPELENLFAEISAHVSTLIDELFERQYKFTPPQAPESVNNVAGSFGIGAESECSSDSNQLALKYIRLIEQLNDVEDELYEFAMTESDSLVDLIENVTDFKSCLTEQLLNCTTDPSEVNCRRTELVPLVELKKSELPNLSRLFDALLYAVNAHGTSSIDFIYGERLDQITYQPDETKLENIYDTIMEQFLEMETTVKEIASGQQSIPGAHSGLDERKWQMLNTIRDIKAFLRKVSNETTVVELLCRSIDKLDDTIIFVYEAYDYIDHLNETISINGLSATDSSKLQYSPDSALNVASKNLEKVIETNKIAEKFESAVKVFEKQHFPFSNEMLLSDLKLPADLEPADNDKRAKVVIDHFYYLKERVESVATLIGEYDQFVLRDVEFSSRDSLVGPFFRWVLEGANEEIKKKLLRGEEIELTPGIHLANKLSAVKFNEIGIKLMVDDDNQQSLDWELENCVATLTMTKSSQYRCLTVIHSFTVDENYSFSHSFKRGSNGKPITKNDVYDKVSTDRNYYLSPYATWKIQIESFKGADLTKFENKKISLELVGRGKYVKCSDCLSGLCDKETLFGQIMV